MPTRSPKAHDDAVGGTTAAPAPPPPPPQALDSEDLAQEAFFAIANSLDKFRGETWPQFLGFAESILSRQIITGARHHGAQRRRLDRRSPLDEAPRSLEGTASAHFMNAEDRSRLQALIEALPEALREPLKMRLAGRTYEEIATALGLSVPNARQRTARAIGRLRDHWPR